MKKSKFSEPQIIKILSLQESDQSVSDICRELVGYSREEFGTSLRQACKLFNIST